MSLRDAACYSLTLVPSLADPKVLELVENYNGPTDGPRAQTPRFARVKEQPRDKEVYSAAIYDYLSGAKLASMGMESTKSKSKSLQLHGPDEDISFEFTGKINFEWTFTFEGNKFRWTRSFSRGSEYICSLDRKPDPRVEICLAKEADKKEPARLQILHYNIDRFPDEIKDLRGLETLLTATFMSFLDDMDSRNQRNSLSPAPDASIVPGASVFGQKTGSSASGQTLNAPQRVISEDDFEPENPNEILVSLNSSIDEHVSRAVWLLEDPHVLFIVIRTRASEATQRALEVSLGVTRFRHREGLDELKQYVIEEEPTKSPSPTSISSLGRGPPKPISLDDPPPKIETLTVQDSTSGTVKRVKSASWSAPNIAIYLSKIDLPDLAPGRRGLQKARSDLDTGNQPPASSSGREMTKLPPPPTPTAPGPDRSPIPLPPRGQQTQPPTSGVAVPVPGRHGKDSSLKNLLRAAAGSR